MNSTASSHQATALQWKVQKIPVGTIDETTPLDSGYVVPIVPKKVPPHHPVRRVHPPDLAKTLLNTMPPASAVATTMPPASEAGSY